MTDSTGKTRYASVVKIVIGCGGFLIISWRRRSRSSRSPDARRGGAAPYRLLWHPVRVDRAAGSSGSARGPAGWPGSPGSAHVVGIVRVQRLNLFLLGHFLKLGDSSLSSFSKCRTCPQCGGPPQLSMCLNHKTLLLNGHRTQIKPSAMHFSQLLCFPCLN